MCHIIDNTRSRLATTVNAEVCLLHWNIGKRIKEDVLYSKRAEYGKEIVKNLADNLTERYGKGWSIYKLQHCVRAAYTFSEEEILYAVRTQLTWTHLRSLMSIEDELKRKFYMEMARIEHWDTRTLDEKIDGMLYERTALSRKPEELIKQELKNIQETNSLTPDAIFRSSYFLDTLGLADTYSEKDLEDAILINLQSFIKEMGNGFAFLDRQKRITVDAVDYRIDLRYLNSNERKDGEESPVGLILCSEGNTEHIEYLMLEEGNIKVAQYYTQLPDKKTLSEKLHKAIAIARENQTVR